MNFKKLISVCLIIVILFTSLCPTSFAAYVYGPGKSSYTVNWKDMYNYAELMDVYIEPIEIEVNTSGLYTISNLMGGNVTTKYIIATDSWTENIVAPLPIATYGSNGENAMDLTRYNNVSNRSTTVYLEAGKKYYILMTGEKGYGLKGAGSSDNSPSESRTLSINLNYVELPEDMEIYETQMSSIHFTAPDYPENLLLYKCQNRGWSGQNVSTDKIAYNPNLTSISGDSINAALENAANVDNEDQNAAWYEHVITWLLLLVGDSVRFIITAVLGDNISIDNILFNEFSSTRLSIFDSSRGEGNKNEYLETSGMLDSDEGEGVITKYFMIFRNISLVAYIVMLLYMGVNILMSSTGNKKAKFKDRIMDWIKGIIILIFFPYVMKYTIVLNDAIVQYIAELRDNLPSQFNLPTMIGLSNERAGAMNIANSGTATNGDMMQTARVKAGKTGRVAYAILYLLLLKELVGFIYIYFKRLISVIFLIIIFPLVTISYAVDKIADGKSQAFNHWFSEFVLNVFIQSFQAINYVVIMSIIFALGNGSENIILVLVGFEFISKGDELLRSMFSKMSGGGANTVPKSLNDAVKTVAAVEVIKEAGKQIGNTGKRIRNLTNNVKNVREKYYNYQETKLYEREHANDWYENSIMNPEKNAIDDVYGNMQKLLGNNGAYTSEEQKQILDRLIIAKNDPNRSQMFQAEFNALSDDEKENLQDLLVANEVVNETLAGNIGAKGALTEREINFNAKINMEIIKGGSSGKYGALYDFLKSKTMLNPNGTPMTDRSGTPISALNYIEKMANVRRLNSDQQRQFEKAQNFFGNVTGLDTSKFGTERVATTRHAPIQALEHSYSETARARSIQNRYGNAGVSADIAEKQERASKLVARMQGYKFQIDQGSAKGMSATEGMKLAMEWEDLAKETDAGVQAILNQLGDAASAGHSMEANVGFNMQQFKTMASLAVMKDRANLEGTEEEKNALIQEAGKTLIEIETERKFVEDADGNLDIEKETVSDASGNTVVKEKRYVVDKVAKQMVQRAEMDDFLSEYGKQYQRAAREHASARAIDCSRYMRTNSTQEEIRDREELARRREELERHYEETAKTQTVSQARAELFRSAVNLGGATTSVALSPLNVATATASAAVVTGATGETKPVTIIGTAAFGAGLENAVESLVPGTEPASRASSNGLGANIDKTFENAIQNHGVTPEQRSDELIAWERMHNSVAKKTNLYRNRLR